jgi:hypothetical protein
MNQSNGEPESCGKQLVRVLLRNNEHAASKINYYMCLQPADEPLDRSSNINLSTISPFLTQDGRDRTVVEGLFTRRA